jgi:hypothetical protein
METEKTVNDIIDYTGLKYDYIIRCIKELDFILKPYIKRGDKNTLLFDSNAAVIFDKIKQYKEQKFSLGTIKKKLLNDLQNTPEETTKQDVNSTDQNLITMIFDKIEESNRKSLELILTTKDQVIEAQKSENNELRKQILLITDGRQPEEVKAEYVKKEVEIQVLKNKTEEIEKQLKQEKESLNETKSTLFDKEKELIIKEQNIKNYSNKLELIEEQKKLTEERLENEKKARLLLEEKEKKKSELLKQLKELEGKWFVGAKRKELLNELEKI